jgi:hypothetical protein
MLSIEPQVQAECTLDFPLWSMGEMGTQNAIQTGHTIIYSLEKSNCVFNRKANCAGVFVGAKPCKRRNS